ncbi:MAG: imidazole glycerol phosphate synthase subunit HisH [Nanoarchaeota archaeon]|nr:imidazole glycerol phosphate synthase subunit HisH [Nanoarchaeota archaeon]
MIAIIDYGAGNLQSVKNALDNLKAESRITDNPYEILSADKIIFPGVGNFGDMVKSLEKKNLIDVIRGVINDGKLFLGICLGLQVLFEESAESPDAKGIGIFKGKVKRFNTNLKVPQIGWNQIKVCRENKIINGLDGNFFYFVHSYYVDPEDDAIVLARTNYGGEFVSGVCKDNIYAFQFHPEKSGEDGLKILKNFAGL